MIKERHRTIARMFAAGFTRNSVAAMTGYTPERVGQLYHDPAMQELISTFRDAPEILEVTGLNVTDMIRHNMLRNTHSAVMHIRDRFDELEANDEIMPIAQAVKIFTEGADRVGLGKHVTSTNINIDFAAQLESAMARSAKVISGSAQKSPPLRAPGEGHDLLPGAGPSPTFGQAGDGGLAESRGDDLPVPRRLDRRF